MNKDNDIKRELEELGSSLGRYRQGSAGVPEGYFDLMEKEVLSKTVDKKSTTRLIQFKKWIPAIAASLIILTSVLWSLNQSDTVLTPDQFNDSSEVISYLLEDEIDYLNSVDLESITIDPMEELSFEDVENYIQSHIEDIDNTMIGDVDW